MCIRDSDGIDRDGKSGRGRRGKPAIAGIRGSDAVGAGRQQGSLDCGNALSIQRARAQRGGSIEKRDRPAGDASDRCQSRSQSDSLTDHQSGC